MQDMPEVGTLTEQSRYFGIAVSVCAYFVAVRLHRAIGAPVLLNPLLMAIVAVAVGLRLAGVPYEAFFRSAEPLHLLLGPVVVLLAVPLWRQMPAIRAQGAGIVPVLLAASLVGIATSGGVALAVGAPAELVASLAPKSVTAAVAVGLSESLGGVAAITAVVVILTGLTGACLGLPLLRAIGVRDPRAQGFAIGVGSHVIGTARALQAGPVIGAFASLGMILNALATAVLIGVLRLVAG